MLMARTLLAMALLAGTIPAQSCGETTSSDSGQAPDKKTDTRPAEKPSTPRFSFKIVHTYPHDPQAFTQGLVFADGRMYESTGEYGRSSLRQVDLETGEVLRILHLHERYFGEGIALFEGKIVQLTWLSNLGFVYDRDSFKLLREFPYSTEGWGITSDGKRLIMSDGTSALYFWDPQKLQETGRVEVTDQGVPVQQLNELEFVKGKICANVWQTNSIAQIDPETGKVAAWIDLDELWAYMDLSRPIDVLNGIAYDPQKDRLFVTGKLWPKLFEIKLIPADP